MKRNKMRVRDLREERVRTIGSVLIELHLLKMQLEERIAELEREQQRHLELLGDEDALG